MKKETALKKKPHESLRLQMSEISDAIDIGAKFSKAVSANHLLSLILKETLDLMSTEVCIIWLKDKAGNFIPRMSFGLKTPAIKSIKVKAGSSLIECIMKKAGPTNIRKISEDRRVPNKIKKIVEKEGVHSLLATPLIVEDERFGVLMVATKSRRVFAETDLKIFDAVARQASLAITNIGLYDRMNRKVREKINDLSTLFTMSRSISSSMDLDLLLTIILEKARLLVKAKYCTLKITDTSRSRLHTAASAGLAGSRKTALENNDELARRVMASGTPLVIGDVNEHFGKEVPANLKRAKARALLMVPLFSSRRRSGVLAAYMAEARAFEKEEIEMLEMVASLCSLAIDNSAMLERIRRDYLNAVKTLAKIIDENDRYTRGHCEKVMKYALAICKTLKLPPRSVNAIRTASLLHDIGKIAIDLGILRKTEKLTKKDWEKIRMHPEIGAKIVSQVGFLNDIIPIIRHHHARYAGGGYPDPKRVGEKIPIGARIIAVADTFDAMTSDRPYRKALPKETALKELKRCSGTQFDPKVVNAFLNSKINN